VEASNIEAVPKSRSQWSQGAASFWKLAAFNEGNAWIGEYEGESPWEMHPEGEELSVVLHGSVDFILELADRVHTVPVTAGEILVIPRGIWHRQVSHGQVRSLGATSGRTEHRGSTG
jgi:quercetin dioxygenase-like cupin family protein